MRQDRKIFHVIWDGNRGGRWWSVVNEDGELVGGAQWLKEIKKHAIGKRFKMGVHPANPPKDTWLLHKNVSWDFYSDTIRWFESYHDTFWR